jgi:hypothetical protein
MLKQLIENGEKIYGDLCQAKKGDELEQKHGLRQASCI